MKKKRGLSQHEQEAACGQTFHQDGEPCGPYCRMTADKLATIKAVRAIWNGIERVVQERMDRHEAVSESQIVDGVAAMCPIIERQRIADVVAMWFEVQKQKEMTDTPEGHLQHAQELRRFMQEHPMDPETGTRYTPQ